MLKAGQFVIVVVTAALAGCGTPPRLNPARGTDWVAEDVASAPVARVEAKPAPSTVGARVAVPTVASTSAPVSVAATNTPPEDRQTWVPLQRWCKANGLPAPVLISAAPAP